MKKIILTLLIVLTFSFVACGKLEKTKQPENLDYSIASKLESMDNNYSDETLKAMAVILRNNLKVKQDYTFTNNPSEKYLKIVKTTNNKVLRDSNKDLIEISFDNTNEYEWQKVIKKSEILDFALRNNLKLTNLSDIEPVLEDEKVIGLNIANKYFDYYTLAKQFNLSSNNIINIYSNKSDIIINGKGYVFFNHFDIIKSEELSNNNYNYRQILEYFFNDLTLS